MTLERQHLQNLLNGHFKKEMFPFGLTDQHKQAIKKLLAGEPTEKVAEFLRSPGLTIRISGKHNTVPLAPESWDNADSDEIQDRIPMVDCPEDDILARIDRERKLETLTGRQREVYVLAVAGYTQTEIGIALGITHQTVSLHWNAIVKKVRER